MVLPLSCRWFLVLGGDPSPLNHSFLTGVAVCGSTHSIGSGFSLVQVHTVIPPSHTVSLGPQKVLCGSYFWGDRWTDRHADRGNGVSSNRRCPDTWLGANFQVLLRALRALIDLNRPDQPHLGPHTHPLPVGSGALFKRSPGPLVFAWTMLWVCLHSVLSLTWSPGWTSVSVSCCSWLDPGMYPGLNPSACPVEDCHWSMLSPPCSCPVGWHPSWWWHCLHWGHPWLPAYPLSWSSPALAVLWHSHRSWQEYSFEILVSNYPVCCLVI